MKIKCMWVCLILIIYTKHFWEAFKDTHSKHNIKPPKEILMKPIPSLMRYILNDLSEIDSENLDLTIDKIREGIDYVQYINLVRSLKLDQ